MPRKTTDSPAGTEPAATDANPCLRLRKKSKQGHGLSPDEQAFCERVYRHFRDWYSRTEAVVFNETVPFGSNVRRPVQE